MAELKSPEITARAVIEKTTPAHPRSPDELKARYVREKMSKEGPKAARDWMEEIRAGKKDEAAIIDQVIGSNLDAAGAKTRSTEQQQRFDKASEFSQLNKDLVEKGYDNLVGSQEKDKARDLVTQVVLSWPDAKNYFSNLPAHLQQQAVKDFTEDILRDPSSAALLLKHQNEALSSGQRAEVNIALKAAFERAQTRKKAKEDEIKANTTSVAAVNKELDEFKITKTKGKDLKDLTDKLPALQTALRDLQGQYQDTGGELANAQNMYNLFLRQNRAAEATQMAQEIRTHQQELRNLENQIRQVNDEVKRQHDLATEKADVEARKKALQEERYKLDDELDELTHQFTVAQVNWNSEEMKGAKTEQEFVDKLKGVITNAALDFLDHRINQARDAQDKVDQEIVQKAKDEVDKRVAKALTSRWENTETRGHLWWKAEKSVLLDKVIMEDSKMLLDQGSDTLLRSFLVRAGLSAAQIKEKMENPEYVKEMGGQVAERAMAARISLGKFSTVEAKKIISTDWGMDLVNRAIAKNDKVKEDLAQLQKAGVITEATAEGMKNLPLNGLLWLLLALFGGVAGAVIKGAELTGKGAQAGAGKVRSLLHI